MAIQFDDRMKASLVSAVCLVGLVIALRNVLHVPAEILSRDVVIYILIYSVFSILYPTQREEFRKQTFNRPLYWSLALGVMTLAIVFLYMI
ncbi:MAG: hypothetical protein WCF84_23880 [Anaerolineae bacterium]